MQLKALPLVILLSMLGVFLASQRSAAQDTPPGVSITDLQDQLENGLKARLPNEFQFIGLVIQRVREKQLSVGEVRSVFQWARRKNGKVPFPYFQRAMRIIAAQKGVAL